MSDNKLPSVQCLVNRIKNRIKYPQVSNKRFQIQTKPQYKPYNSPVKQLKDEQIADMPILTWDNDNNENSLYQSNKKYHKTGYNNNNYHQQDNFIKSMNKQTIRNLAYCQSQRQLVPRVPHRKHQGDRMKTLIYDTHYAAYPLKQPVYVNYDWQYAEHERKYQAAQSLSTNFYKKRTKSLIKPRVDKDRLSGKKYPKFMN